MPTPVIGNSAVDDVYRRIKYDCFAQAARFRQQQAGNIQQARAANGRHAQINRNLRPHALSSEQYNFRPSENFRRPFHLLAVQKTHRLFPFARQYRRHRLQ